MPLKNIRAESGSSIIWFINLLGITVLLLLTMVATVDQFIRVANFKNYLEQYSLSIKSLTNLGFTIEQAELKLKSVVSKSNYSVNAHWLADSKTIEASGCFTWEAPLVVFSRDICLIARAR